MSIYDHRGLSSEALSTLIRFQMKTELFCPVFKKICVHTYRFRIVFASPHYNAVSVWKRCNTLSALGQMNSTNAHFNTSACKIGGKLKPHGSVCPPFWMLTVEWFGAWSCLFWWRHRFQIASFSPSTLENSVFKKHRFQIAPLWRAFSNGSVFGDRFRRCSVDDSRIRSKTAPISFENGLVWTGPELWQGHCCAHEWMIKIVYIIYSHSSVTCTLTCSRSRSWCWKQR